jgi:hypothetical protein
VWRSSSKIAGARHRPGIHGRSGLPWHLQLLLLSSPENDWNDRGREIARNDCRSRTRSETVMKLFLASQNPLDLKAMATRRSGHQGQFTPAHDLRAELDHPLLHPLPGCSRLRARGLAPRLAYFTLIGLGLMITAITGQLGGNTQRG